MPSSDRKKRKRKKFPLLSLAAETTKKDWWKLFASLRKTNDFLFVLFFVFCVWSSGRYLFMDQRRFLAVAQRIN